MADGKSGFQVAGAAYDRFVGRYSPRLASAVCDLAGIGAGTGRALDVGCGTGALTGELADRLGAGAVAAVDPSETFLATCRARVPDADVRLAGAEALPFGDGEFGAVLSQLVVNFVGDAPAALREMRRVARTDAVVAGAVWDYTGGMVMLRSFWDAAAEVAGPAATARDEGRVMRFCTPESLGDLWHEAGLRDVRVEAVDVSAAYDDFDDLWAPLAAGAGPAGAFTVALDDQTRDRLRRALHERLGAPDGAFELDARAWCAVGRS